VTDRDAIVHRLRAAGCVYAEDEATLLVESADSPGQLETWVAARVSGAPLEHLLGWAEFNRMRVAVAPGVFVPRARSGLLVNEAVRRLGPGDVVIDLCCGCGAIGTAIAARAAQVEVHAVDIDAAAVSVARRNLAPYGGHCYTGDLDEPLPERLGGRVRVIVANAPYVPSDEIEFMPSEARLYEPPHALDGGTDGVALHRRIAAIAPRWLAAEGALIIETSRRQAGLTASAMSEVALISTVVTDDELDGTAVIGVRRG
jgi:release factor glutamine methyltransferase